jgi:glutathione S-transferase
VSRDGDRVIGETSIIIEHVAGTPPVPSLQARLWDRLCDQYLSDAVQAIVVEAIVDQADERAVTEARSLIEMVYGMLEAQSVDHEQLVGDAFTIAAAPLRPGCSTPWRCTRGTSAASRG